MKWISDRFLGRRLKTMHDSPGRRSHLFEFGGSGSTLTIANDEEPTNHVLSAFGRWFKLEGVQVN